MKKMVMAVGFLACAFSHADTLDDAVVSGIKAHQAAKCMVYLEVAGAERQTAYDKLAKIYTDNISIYIDNALNEDFNSKAISSSIPMSWYVLVERNKFNKQFLAGRILQWTDMVETQRVGDIYAPNERTIPESAGRAAYNQENCVLLEQ
ncbi:hypothetical protein ACL653_29000 [Klebsiella pneumoniae]